MLDATSKRAILCLFLSLLSTRIQAQITPLDTGSQLNQQATPTKIEDSLHCYKIAGVEVAGNKRTKSRIILQEMKLRTDSTYCSRNWKKLLYDEQSWIYGLGIFDTVSVSMQHVPSRDSLVHLLVNVKERWYVYPIPVIKVSQYSFGYWWQHLDRDLSYVSYGVGLAHHNFRGLNDKFFTLLQLGNELSSIFTYIGPYSRLPSGALLGYSLTTTFSRIRSIIHDNLSHEAQDIQSNDSFLQTRSISIATLNYRSSINTEHIIGVSFEYHSIADTLHKLNPTFLQSKSKGAAKRRRVVGVGYSLKNDLRKQPRYPLEGSYLEITVSQQGLGIFSEMNLSQLNLFYGKYVPLGKKWYLSGLLRSTLSAPFDQAYVDYQELSLNARVRGYNIYFIQGPLLFHSNMILKKHIFHWAYRAKKKRKGLRHYLSYIPFTLYGYVYANANYVQRYSEQHSDRLNNVLLFGVGPGMELLTIYDFVLGAQYAFTRYDQLFGFYVTIGGGT